MKYLNLAFVAALLAGPTVTPAKAAEMLTAPQGTYDIHLWFLKKPRCESIQLKIEPVPARACSTVPVMVEDPYLGIPIKVWKVELEADPEKSGFPTNVLLEGIGPESEKLTVSVYWAFWTDKMHKPNGVVTFEDRRFAAGAPEPTSWALLILGFGLVGGSLRGRARRPAPAVRPVR